MSPTSPDLESMASTLASNIETTMASLYNLQTSLINAHNKLEITTSTPHKLVSRLRPRLKELWEAIRAFLQMSHAFGGDVIILQESLGKESADDCMEFLTEMSITSTRLLEWSKTLTSDAINLAKDFSSWTPQFENTLRNSKTHVHHANFGQYESERLTLETYPLDSRANLLQGYTGQWNEDPIVVECSKADKVTQAFVEANIAAIRPDGWKSLDDTIDALKNLNLILTQFIQYWQSTSDSCRLYILNGSINIKTMEAKSFATKWRANRAALEGAILSIAKSCDAALVDAVGLTTLPKVLPPPGHRTRLVKPRPVRETPISPVSMKVAPKRQSSHSDTKNSPSPAPSSG